MGLIPAVRLQSSTKTAFLSDELTRPIQSGPEVRGRVSGDSSGKSEPVGKVAVPPRQETGALAL